MVAVGQILEHPRFYGIGELWPVSYFYTHFWKWQLRDFIVNQDKFDEVVKYWIENLRKMQKKHEKNATSS